MPFRAVLVSIFTAWRQSHCCGSSRFPPFDGSFSVYGRWTGVLTRSRWSGGNQPVDRRRWSPQAGRRLSPDNGSAPVTGGGPRPSRSITEPVCSAGHGLLCACRPPVGRRVGDAVFVREQPASRCLDRALRGFCWGSWKHPT